MANAPDRRTFLFLLGLGVLGVRTAGLGGQAGLRLGFDLPVARADQPTLRTLAAIGYREVELGPAEATGQALLALRRVLDQHAVAAPSRQVPMSMVFSNWRVVLNDCRILGARQVVCQEVPAPERASITGYRRVAELLNSAGKITQYAGVQLVVRVHPEDLKARDGVVPFDDLLANTHAALVKFQVNLAVFASAGRDPLADFARHRNRFASLQIADAAAADLAKILASARNAGVQHFFVANERPDPAFELAKQTFEQISAMKL